MTAIDAVLQQAVEAGELPGVVAAATSDRETIYEGAAGRRGLADPTPMTPDTVFWIASMTKAVTATAAMQQVEQGKLALDAPLGPLLPGLAQPQVLEGFDAAGKPRLRPAKRPITLRQLLTHTAGFGYGMWDANAARYMAQTGVPAPGSGLNAALAMPLMFDPGERWEYGISIDWAGKAVEAVTGLTLEAYFRQHIFAPLGMHDTGYVLQPNHRARLAAMHQRQADGSLQPASFEPPQAPESFMGGGGLFSAARDYLIFLRMLLASGAPLLKPETVRLMAQNHIGDIAAGILKTVDPAISYDADFFPGQPQRWGLSFLINMTAVPGGRSAGSLTWGGLRNTYFWLDPAKRIGGLIMTQILPFADPKVLKTYAAFERAIYAGR